MGKRAGHPGATVKSRIPPRRLTGLSIRSACIGRAVGPRRIQYQSLWLTVKAVLRAGVRVL